MNSIRNIHIRIREQFVYMAVFATCFVVMGHFLPRVYLQYFDRTEYYKIELPIPVADFDYRPGDFVNVFITRTSMIDNDGVSIIQLNLLRKDAQVERVSHEVRQISMPKGSGTVVVGWKLPEDISSGNYFFDGVVTYEVQGIKKHTKFVTDLFQVTQKGVSEDGESTK